MPCSLSTLSLFFPTHTRFLCHRDSASIFNLSSRRPFLISRVRCRNSVPPLPSQSASIAGKELEVSWVCPDSNASDGYNGWAVIESSSPKDRKQGSPTLLIIGIETSIAVLLVAFAYLSLSSKGFVFRFRNSRHALHEALLLSTEGTETQSPSPEAPSEEAITSETIPDSASDSFSQTLAPETELIKRNERNLGLIVIPAAVDSAQQEALSILKKLKIIEDDVKADELCTRREYARWLVCANVLLERSPNHQLVPSVALAGSTAAAFDDVNTEDPDFGFFQALAEAGIVPSKLSGNVLSSDLHGSQGQGVNFFPERFISRQDLIAWKAKLDYNAVPLMNEEISRIGIDFMDVREISPDAFLEVFKDLMAGDKSIIRRVFGKTKRFQPRKPSTKAQAAVALTSGKMAETIHDELTRLEAESSSRKIAMEEIRCVILERGEIQEYWAKKLDEEKDRAMEINKVYHLVVDELQNEKIVQENNTDLLRQRAAMDCQKQLLASLKEEVDKMSERLASERAELSLEQHNIKEMLSDLQFKYEGMLDTKSILEAEIEALQILRSWIEHEARKSQTRAKVLEDAGRRWRWGKQS